MFSIYRIFAKIFPRNIKRSIIKLLEYSNIDVEINRFLGFQISFSMLLSAALAVYLLLFFDYNFWIVLGTSFFFIQAFVYTWLILSADNKGKFTESVLPDVMQLMSSNLRAGATIDKALLMTARPEFGQFKKELDRVGKEVTVGKGFQKALLDLSSRIKSERLEKTVSLILNGMKSGGELAPLLERTAEDLRDQQIMDKKIRASIGMYKIFIFVAIGLASPFLFGLSTVIVEVLTRTFSSISMPDTSAVPLAIAQVSITPEFIFMFAMVFIATSCTLGSLVLGLVSKGKAKEGTRYIIPLIIIAILIFIGTRKFLMYALGGVFGM
ncbi:type II secretion system F family protein [candidate division KSB1 bacterium]